MAAAVHTTLLVHHRAHASTCADINGAAPYSGGGGAFKHRPGWCRRLRGTQGQGVGQRL